MVIYVNYLRKKSLIWWRLFGGIVFVLFGLVIAFHLYFCFIFFCLSSGRKRSERWRWGISNEKSKSQMEEMRFIIFFIFSKFSYIDDVKFLSFYYHFIGFVVNNNKVNSEREKYRYVNRVNGSYRVLFKWSQCWCVSGRKNERFGWATNLCLF